MSASTSPSQRTVIAFVVLAILSGPVTGFVSSSAGFGAQWLGPVHMAVVSGLAGLALLALAVVRRERLPRSAGLLALLVLFVPQWVTGLLSPPAIRAASALHETPWGVAFLVSLAAPLWLGLLSALQWVRDEAPRAVAGASIAGIGAVCLVIPTNAYAIAVDQIPVAALHVLLGLLTVFSWSYARPRLAGTGTAAVAGCFLVLTALGGIVASPLFADGQSSTLDWRTAVAPLLLMVLVNGASWWLWFWLLERMTLAAFGMRALAAWTAAILPGLLLFGFLSWRTDAAIAIAVAALVVALRARVAKEQPLALGLGDG